MVEFFISMVAYIGILFLSHTTLEHVTSGPLHYGLALLPVLPIAMIFASVLRFLRGTDELTRTVQITSLAVAAGLTALLSATYGFLEGVGFPRISAWFTYCCVMLLYGLSIPIVSRRYR